MQLAEPLVASWKAELRLSIQKRDRKSVLAERRSDGPLVVQKPLYPEGEGVCHAIVVHPPGGIAGGDELSLRAGVGEGAHALLTTPGAGKWYRSGGPLARQDLAFDVAGSLEWLPRETIVFDGAIARLDTEILLGENARYVGWEVVCLGRRGSGERFGRGRVSMRTRVSREGRLLFVENGEIEGGGRLMRSPAGLAGCSVFAIMLATQESPLKAEMPKAFALTHLPGLQVARYLGDSGEEALRGFSRIWKLLRPAVIGREAVEPRIWST